jgi:3-dehydroquinate synthetase
MTYTVDTLMALAYKIRDARTYDWDVSEAVEAGNTLRAALTEALSQPNHSEQRLDMVAAQSSQPVREPLTSDQLMALTLCHEDKRVSVSKVQRILKISYKEAQELCQAIIDAGQCEGFEISPNLHSIGGDK